MEWLDTLTQHINWAWIWIPLISAIVGWGTNVIALKMTFYPLDFVGLGPIGWQGIIPSKARKMASITVDLMTRHLVKVTEVFQRLDPERIVQELQPSVETLIRQTIDEVVQESHPDLWKNLPEPVKEELYRRAIEETPNVVHESLEEIQDHIEDLLDLKELAIEALVQDRQLLNNIFLECGREEFLFIERSGFFFGLLFGLLQAALYTFSQASWIMPTMGFVVGTVTNMLALRMIFSPRDPVRFGPLTWQGLFFIRQPEVAAAFARMVSTHVVNTQNLMRRIFQGPTSDRILSIIERHLQRASKNYGGGLSPVIKFTVGSARYTEIKAHIVERIATSLPEGPIDSLHGYAEEALDIERTLRERLTSLPREQFEGLLRPIFQEDEWKLILVGAALGALVGFGLIWIPVS